MREIKFRAWDKHIEEMLECSPLHLGDYLCDKDMILMQYTGLKDKNGKEIYEGDIVECKDYNKERGQHYIGEVTFSVNDNCSSGFSIGSDGWYKDEIEIIGNIYESPELLK